MLRKTHFSRNLCNKTFHHLWPHTSVFIACVQALRGALAAGQTRKGFRPDGFARRLPELTGSRGDVFVVRTSKPVENLWRIWVILIAFNTVSLHSLYTANQETEGSHARSASPFGRRAVRQRGYGLWLLVFKIANNKVDLGQIRSEFTVDS